MPAMVEWSGNKCDYGCVYCFVENSSKYKVNNPVEIINQLKNPTRVAGEAIKLGYPLLFSNRTDPFSLHNLPVTRLIADITANMPNGVIWQTKTGSLKDIEAVLNAYAKAGKKNAVFAITLNTLDDGKRKLIEPKAPSTANRIKAAEMVKSAGFGVMANVAPMHSGIVPPAEFPAFADELLQTFDIAHSCTFHISRKAYQKRKPELDKAGIDTPSGKDYAETARDYEAINPRFTLTDGTNLTLYRYYKEKLGKVGILYGSYMERLQEIPSGTIITKEDYIEPFAKNYADIIDKDMRMREYLCLQDLNLYKRFDVQKIRTLRELLGWMYNNPSIVFSPLSNKITTYENGSFIRL
jgi:DNA repair photolyase